MFPLCFPHNKSDNIFGLFRPVYVFVRLWGYISFNVNLNATPLPNNVSVSLLNRILLVIQISLYLAYLTLSLTAHQSNSTHLSNLVIYGLNKVNEFGIFCGAIFVIVDVVNGKKIWRMFQTFLGFDKVVYCLNILQLLSHC